MARPSEKQLELAERRKKVSELAGLCSVSEIASRLDISTSTVERDIRAISKSLSGWIDNTAQYGFLLSYQQSLERSAKRRRDLEDELNRTTNPNHRFKLWQLIQDEDKNYVELLSKAPVVHALKRAVGEVNVQAA
jgi:IS30 family transposase